MATTKQLAFSLKDSMSLEDVKTVIQSRKLRLSPKQISAFLGQLSKLGRPMAAWNVMQSFPAIGSEGLKGLSSIVLESWEMSKYASTCHNCE